MVNIKKIKENIYQLDKEGKISKDKPTIVYCLHGIRSSRILEFLKAEGYKNIYHLDGGFEAYIKD